MLKRGSRVWLNSGNFKLGNAVLRAPGLVSVNLPHMASLASALMAGILFAVVPSYFDAHNHITGILPYQAYANLPAFIATFSNPREQVNYDDRLALYRYLADVWYPSTPTSSRSTST